jgi:hypothetical protein
MEYWQEEIRRRLERFHHDEDGQGMAISIKVRVASNCFCYGHHRHFEREMDRHRDMESRIHWEYVEHESGPEWLLYLALTAAGLGVVEKSLGLIKSVVDLVALSVKSHAEERRRRNQRPEPLSIVVRGFDPVNVVFFEKPVIEIDWDSPPAEQEITDSLSEVIQQIAEERVRQDQKER